MTSTHSGAAAGPEESGDLIVQIADLRQRVVALENRLGITASTAPVVAAIPESGPRPSLVLGGLDLPPNIVPILGRTLVAIAGAYVLRALTEWAVMPTVAGVAIGLIYALFWLWFATRPPAGTKFAAAVSCCTSVLILSPLVWEATQSLKVMSSGISAGILAAYALIALFLAARAQQKIVGSIAGASAIAMAIALLLARDDIAPYTTALLVIAAAAEFGALRDLQPGARPLAAAAADASVLLFSWLMSAGHHMPETWFPASSWAVLCMQLGLAVIYVGTAVGQSVVRRRTLAFAEMAQTAAALLIAIGGAVWVFKEQRAIMFGLGIAAMAGGVMCYAISFLLFEHNNKWNFRAWATFGLLLTLAGLFLPFSRNGFWVLSCVCAAACCWTCRVQHLPTLALHGAVFLSVGSAAAGGTGMPLAALFGSLTDPAPWLESIAVLITGALCWAAIAGISTDGPGRWRIQIAYLAIAAHTVWIATGVVMSAMLIMGRGLPADTLGTVVLTALSLLLAWAGTHWGRRELVWLIYGFMLLGAYKLVIRDFRHEGNIALVVSLLCYGGALILLPRMLRHEEPRSEA